MGVGVLMGSSRGGVNVMMGVRVGSWCGDSIYPIPVVCIRWDQHLFDTG